MVCVFDLLFNKNQSKNSRPTRNNTKLIDSTQPLNSNSILKMMNQETDEFSKPVPTLDLTNNENNMVNVLEDLQFGKDLPKDQTHFDVNEAKRMLTMVPSMSTKLQTIDENSSHNAEVPNEPMFIPDSEEVASDKSDGNSSQATGSKKQTGKQEKAFIPKGRGGRFFQKKSSSSEEGSSSRQGKRAQDPRGDTSPPKRQAYISNKQIRPQASNVSQESEEEFIPDYLAQKEIIDMVFFRAGLRCDVTMENHIMAKYAARKYPISEEEIEWFCAGVKCEQHVSMSKRMEQMITQMANELTKIQVTSKTLADIEAKQKENLGVLNKMRFSPPKPEQSESSASSRTPNTKDRTEKFYDYRGVLQAIGIPKKLATDPKYENHWGKVLKEEDIILANEGRMTKGLKEALFEEVMDLLFKIEQGEIE